MKHSRILIILMLLGGFLYPTATRALDTPSVGEAINDMNKIENTLVQYGVIPQDVANSYGDIMNIFSCIDTAKDEVTVMKCIDKFKDTYIGGALLQAVPSWFWDLLDVYIDIRTLNIPELFLNMAEAAVCAIVEALAWGVDICGIIDAFIDVGEDLDAIAKAVVQFAEEIGAAAWHSVKCTVKPSSCEDKLTGVQIAWRDFFQNILTMNGETIVDAEQTIGYIHRAFEKLAERFAVIADVTGLAATDIGNAAAVEAFLGNGTSSGFLLTATNAISSLEDTTTGIVKNAETTLQTEITNIGNTITTKQAAVVTMPSNLENQMAHDDALLSVSQQQYSYMNELFQAQQTETQSLAL